MNATDWYTQPLSGEDLTAGMTLLLIGTVGIAFYLLLAFILLKNSGDTTGFRYLFSEAIADSFALFIYGTWPGLTVLFKSRIIPSEMQHVEQIILDWVWFIICYHYSLIAWSRLYAIRFPVLFRTQTPAKTFSICCFFYIAALVQAVVNQQLDFYVLFYYEPSAYGLVAEDFVKYKVAGHAQYLFTFNAIALIIPFILYALAIYYYIRRKQTTQPALNAPNSHIHQNNSKIERNLIIPSILNSIVFLSGQIVLTIGWDGGKWFSWSVLVLFCLQALANPVLLLVFSSAIRQKMIDFLKMFEKSQGRRSTVGNAGSNGAVATSKT